MSDMNSGENLDYEQMIQLEMERTGQTRDEIITAGRDMQASMEEQLAKFLADAENTN